MLESSKRPLPDLSLNISPPNCDSPSSRISNSNSSSSSFNLSRPYNDTSFTDLSLAHPSNDELQKSFNGHQESQNPYRHIYQSHNHGAEASDGLKPIKGIPVYPNRPFPFMAVDHSRRLEKDQKMRFYHQISSYPSSSSFPSPYFVGGLDHHMPMLNLGPNSRGGAPRFSSGYHHEPPHHGIMRSRFLSKLPAKRSMRAPRMRWTSTLHSRFVHAVELLGGHESNFTIFLICCN